VQKNNLESFTKLLDNYANIVYNVDTNKSKQQQQQQQHEQKKGS
jgi:hypothetical protein